MCAYIFVNTIDMQSLILVICILIAMWLEYFLTSRSTRDEEVVVTFHGPMVLNYFIIVFICLLVCVSRQGHLEPKLTLNLLCIWASQFQGTSSIPHTQLIHLKTTSRFPLEANSALTFLNCLSGRRKYFLLSSWWYRNWYWAFDWLPGQWCGGRGGGATNSDFDQRRQSWPLEGTVSIWKQRY